MTVKLIANYSTPSLHLDNAIEVFLREDIDRLSIPLMDYVDPLEKNLAPIAIADGRFHPQPNMHSSWCLSKNECGPVSKRRRMKRLTLLLGIGFLSLTIISCGDNKKPPPPPSIIVQAPDYKPIGEGIKVHSYALIGVAVIIAIALMSKNKNI